MNAKIEIMLRSGRVIKAEAYQGNKSAPWNPAGNHYKILVDYFTTPGNKKAFQFNFWDSCHNKINVIPCDVRGALAAWANDVFTSMNAESVDDLAFEFGYDKPSEAIRVYREVKRAEGQYKKIEMSEDDLQELADY